MAAARPGAASRSRLKPPSRLSAWKRRVATGAMARTTSAADAALLSRAVGRPVRVQLTREQEHQWEPKGAAQLIDVDGGLDADGGVAAYDFDTRYPSNVAPTLALLLTGGFRPRRGVGDGRPHRDRRRTSSPTSRHHPRYGAHRARLVASRRVGVAQRFRAREFVSTRRPRRPASTRSNIACAISRITRGRGSRRAVAAVPAGSRTRRRRSHGARRRWAARARLRLCALLHGEFPGSRAAWSTWVADVDVNRVTGEVSLHASRSARIPA